MVNKEWVERVSVHKGVHGNQANLITFESDETRYKYEVSNVYRIKMVKNMDTWGRYYPHIKLLYSQPSIETHWKLYNLWYSSEIMLARIFTYKWEQKPSQGNEGTQMCNHYGK